MVRTLVFLAFFCSGFTSLVLETLWMRMLVLVFGGTTLATVTILTAFMGGLGLGSAIAGRLSHKIKRPLWTYGWLELGVALYALSSPWWIGALPKLYQWVPMDWPQLAVIAVRFLLCVALLLLPTALMGATLPVLSQYIARHKDQIGFDVGLLYSTNTWGAVTGTLLGGFVLLPLWGHQQSLHLAASLLLFVALGMLWLSRRQDEATAALIDPDDEDAIGLLALERRSTPQQRRLALWVIGLTGATAMICQVVWSRTLAMVIGSSTYAFTLILGLFLFGLALGAAWGAWLVKRSLDLAASWSTLLLVTGCSIALGNLIIDRLPLLFVWLVYDSVGKIGVVQMFALKAAITALPILLPTLLMGTFFPLALAVYARHEEAASASVGRLYAANTFGSIAGSIATGFVLIPLLGLQGSLALCVSLYCAAAFALQRSSHTRADKSDDPDAIDEIDAIDAIALPSSGGRSAMVVALIVGVAIWLAPRWHPGRLSLGMFRLSLMNTYTYNTVKTTAPVLFYKEGISATVTVQGGARHRGLKVNGKADASSISDSGTQVASGALPMLLHPAARDVMIIGWGSGMTAGTALHFPLRSLVALEIEPAVVRAARLFRKWNFRPRDDQRLQLLYNDGRNYLARTPRRFDVISSEPSNPWMAGTANLFTTEFFRLARSRLKPGGLHCQFIQLYELSHGNILTLLRSARAAFPYVRLFEVEPNSYDTLLVASGQPIVMDLDTLRQKMAPRRFDELWRRMEITTAFGWLPRLAMGEREIDALLKRHKVPQNTDDHNVIEFTAPFDLVRHASSTAAQRFIDQVKAQGLLARHYFRWRGRSLSKSQPADVWLQAAWSYLRYGKLPQVQKLLLLAAQAGADQARLSTLTQMLTLMRSQERAPRLPSPKRLPMADRALMRQLHQARTLFFQDEEKRSIKLLKGILPHKAFVKRHPAVWFYLGASARHTHQNSDAVRYYQRYLQASTPTHRKANKPADQTTTKPTSLPSPTTRPTRQRATQPTSTPSALPSPQPKPQPTSQPTRTAPRPTSRPTSSAQGQTQPHKD